MGSKLPALSYEAFKHDLKRSAPSPLESSSVEALWIHYRELLRWNPRLSLVGPGTAGEIVQRHYGESLAALPHLPEKASILDAGSGGGFPGFVLAAARPGLDVTLLEPRARKWSFLKTAIRKVKSAGFALSCRALDARVDSPLPASPALPEKIDIVTCRALALGPARLDALAQKYPGVRFLLWTSDTSAGDSSDDIRVGDAQTRESQLGGKEPGHEPSASNPPPLGDDHATGLPPTYQVARRIHLQGSRQRFIVDLTTRIESEGKQDGP